MEEIKGLVSVGIPTYNRPEGLKRTLQQICNQTYPHLEIFISDNCSPNPEVREIAQSFAQKDERVTYIRQEENIGGHNNFKFVLSRAKGEFYMWAADDDEWDPRFIETCLMHIGESSFCMQSEFCDYYRKREHREYSRISPLSPNKNYSNLISFLKKNNNNLFYGIYRTKDLDFFKRKEIYFDGTDWYMLIYMLANFSVVTFDECLFITGIDQEDYVQKPFFEKRGKQFIWTPLIRNGSKAILKSNKLKRIEKIRCVRIFLERMAHSFVKYESSHRPIQARIVLFFLKSYLYVAKRKSQSAN